MSRRQNLQDFFEKISLSQRISADDPNMKDYSTADVDTALSLALFNVLIKHNEIDKDDPNIKLIMDILKENSKAILASSPNTDIYTKLGFRKPQKERVFNLGTATDQEVNEPDL